VIFAAFMPSSGHSPLIVGLVAAGFALFSATYWLATGRGQSSQDSGGSGSVGGMGMPAEAAQPRNS
jgi:hypothetical protein